MDELDLICHCPVLTLIFFVRSSRCQMFLELGSLLHAAEHRDDETERVYTCYSLILRFSKQ